MVNNFHRLHVKFQRTCLSNGDNIIPLQDRRNGVLLDRRREVVLSELDVGHHGRMDTSIFELRRVLGWIIYREEGNTSYPADGNDLRRALKGDLKLKVLVVLTTAHLKLATEELVLKLRDGWCDFAVLVLPLIDCGPAMVVRVVA